MKSIRKPDEKAKKDAVGFGDRVILVLRDKDGKVKRRYDSKDHPHKTITNAGMAAVAALLLNDIAEDDFDWIAIGTGVAAAAVTDTTLGTEQARKAATGTRVTTTVTNDTAQLVATFAAADGLSGTDAITETGMFNLAAAGDMLFRQVFAAISCDWDAGDTLEMTLQVQCKQGA